MAFDIARIADPGFFAENRIPAHSDHRWFASTEEAAGGLSSFEQNLSGRWRFHYAPSPAELPDGWVEPGFDTAGWDEITVPGHLQLQGYGHPQYTNTQYPWDGHEQVLPGEVPQRFNPVGCYRTSFTLDQPLGPRERLSVSFHGAESAVACWLNGRYVGYGADSFTPSEFDLTEHLVDGENVLAAAVFRFTSGSWLEDQDFYRFSGLFRDVVLYRRPSVHVENLRITTVVADDLASATLTLRADLTGEGRVRARLEGLGDLEPGDDGTLTLTLDRPRLWSAEDPYLYQLSIEVSGPEGELTEVIPQRVGVRRFGIEDGLLRLNGRRLVFNGVNRHEFGLNGRVMTREQTETDLRLCKANNINAVRTSHYPNNSFFYALCDEIGLYVIDEMNLETHGLWDRLRFENLDIEAEAVPGDKPEWLPVLLDRANNMFARDVNHPSILLWSCGNESFGGTDLLAVGDWFRAHDTRPVHYEGVFWDPRYPQTTDVVSQMYTPAATIEAFLAEHRDKPFVLCEYAHAMGNSFGAVDRYVDLAYREPLFQGGFIWDFADQAIALTDRHGTPFFGYGGDCGEAPTDYDFSANGLLYADHTPTPKLAEARYLYQPLRISITRAEITVENRYVFTDAESLDGLVTLARQGETLDEQPLNCSVAPGKTAMFALPVALPDEPGEYTVDVSFRLRDANSWGPAGHEVAWEQAVFEAPGAAPRRAAGRPRVVHGIHNIGAHGDGFGVLFSKLYGGLVSYRRGDRELLRDLPKPSFWHAPTANERGWGMPFENGQWLLASRYAKATGFPEVVETDEAVEVRYTYLLPSVPAGQCDVTYMVEADGYVGVTVVLRPGEGLPDVPEFGMRFTADASLAHLRWYGEGPHECYVDRRGSARLGVHAARVDDQLTPYVRPQESGSHTGVRWAEVTDDNGVGLRFDCADGMEFSALPWTPYEIENARHPNDLPPVQHTVLRPALMRRGVGGDDSWGARTLPDFLLPTGELTFSFGFRGIG